MRKRECPKLENPYESQYFLGRVQVQMISHAAPYMLEIGDVGSTAEMLGRVCGAGVEFHLQ